MTIFYPDVSKVGQGALTIEPKTVALVAKATEGTDFYDGDYTHFQNEAKRVGAEFCAYHFLWTGSPAEAKWAFDHVGPSVPLSVDAENTSVATGVAQILSFVHFYRQLGGLVHVVYLPKWYWQQHGSPDLTPLTRAGLVLNSSAYTAYSDSGEGWLPYGGVTPTIWQYTDRLPYAGTHVDFNAFKGTVQQLHNVWHYGTPVGPTGSKPPVKQTVTNISQAIQHLLAALKYHPGNQKILAAIRGLRGIK